MNQLAAKTSAALGFFHIETDQPWRDILVSSQVKVLHVQRHRAAKPPLLNRDVSDWDLIKPRVRSKIGAHIFHGFPAIEVFPLLVAPSRQLRNETGMLF